jgi:hypothetical protein
MTLGHALSLRLHRLFRATAVALLLMAMASTAYADGPQFVFDLTVQPPASPRDPFQVQLTETLTGATPGVNAGITYKLVVVDPGNQVHVLLGPVSVANSFGGGHAASTVGYWPEQNGEFTFRVVRIDGSAETTLVERRAATDKALASGRGLPSPAQLDGEFAVTAIRVTPEQPIVGQAVRIEVSAANFSAEAVSRTVTVVLSDDSGDQTLGTGSFALDPGLSGAGEMNWVPERATVGVLNVMDQELPVTVLDHAPPPASIEPANSQPDETDCD